MYTRKYKHCCTLAALTLSVIFAPVFADQLKATATIDFHGTSTLHGFDGSVTSQTFTAIFAEMEDGQATVSATAKLNVSDMTTLHGKRDKNMLKMLDQKNFDLITGTLSAAKLPAKGSSTAPMKLKIRDVEQQVEATLSDYIRDGDQATCVMTFPISLKAFGLKRPSVMGLIRVGDLVTVECTIQGRIISKPEGH